MILIIDNYDSFTYNLYQYIGELNDDINVVRNDKITVDEIERMKPTHIVISPGPGYPKDAGISIEAIQRLYKKIPILGVCLGHQAIGEAFGGRIGLAGELMHGKVSDINIKNECRIFKNIPVRIKAGRYHSLIIEKNTLPKELEITASTDDGEIMGVQHREYPVFGIQFHPESILTPEGKQILNNFLQIAI